MASPSNDIEPESPDDEIVDGDEEILEPGYDLIYYWDRYRQVILMAAGIVVLGLVGYGVYDYNQSRRVAAAGAALAQAGTEDDYRQIMSNYAGTAAAGDASLLLASKLRDEKKYDEATQVLQDFMDKNPNHPLVHAGDLGIAETLEAEGKKDDAIAKYEEVAAKYPDTYSAPVAVLAEANILKAEGKIEDARRLYENFVAQFPNSEFTQEAMAEMHLLRSTPGAAVAASPAAGPEGLPASLFKPAEAAPAASAAPVASPKPAPSAAAPVMPVVPGTSPH